MTVSPNNDIELIDLCKQVYKATGWEMDSWKDFQLPVYTSDYLLVKLSEKGIEVTLTNSYPYDSVERYRAGCYLWMISDWNDEYKTSDTPLKALLKLTLALHKAGYIHD